MMFIFENFKGQDFFKTPYVRMKYSKDPYDCNMLRGEGYSRIYATKTS